MPSRSSWVYLPSRPFIRILAVPLTAEVCCVAMPILSFNSILIPPGFIDDFSSSSSAANTSTRVAISFILRLDLVVWITTSSSSLPAGSSWTVKGCFTVERGKLKVNFLAPYPAKLNISSCRPSGIPDRVTVPVLSADAPIVMPE